MKKARWIVLCLLLAALTACGQTADTPAEKELPMPEEYGAVLMRYRSALADKWTVEQCMRNGVNYLLGMSQYKTAIGYAVKDLDGDGTAELLIATVPPAEDALSQKLIYDLYTVKDGEAILVFGSLERNRIYWLGGDRFANVGSNGYDDSVNTTLSFDGVSLSDLGTAADESDYVQLELTELTAPE